MEAWRKCFCSIPFLFLFVKFELISICNGFSNTPLLLLFSSCRAWLTCIVPLYFWRWLREMKTLLISFFFLMFSVLYIAMLVIKSWEHEMFFSRERMFSCSGYVWSCWSKYLILLSELSCVFEAYMSGLVWFYDVESQYCSGRDLRACLLLCCTDVPGVHLFLFVFSS